MAFSFLFVKQRHAKTALHETFASNKKNPKEPPMRHPKLAFSACVSFLVLMLTLTVAGQTAETNCEDGNGKLNPAQPQGISVQELIQKFAGKEAIFKDARNHYTYTHDVIVETMDGTSVDGEFRQTTDVLYDDKGRREEKVTFAPQSTLTRIGITKEDFDDFRNRLPFVLTTQDLGEYDILYVGQQRVDELDTYVFDIAPKKIDKNGGPRFFQGRIWVDNRDYQIVKTCGKNVPDIRKKNDENLSPKFVTYREQVDGQYWFPTYTRADDVLHFSSGDVQIREIVKYTNYKRFGVKTRITYGGEVKQPQPK